MRWHSRTAIQRSADSDASQIAPSVIYRDTRGFCAVWNASQRSRRPVRNSWLCVGFVLHELLSWLRGACACYSGYTCLQYGQRSKWNRRKSMRVINVALFWSIGTRPLPCFALVPLKMHQASVLLVTDSSQEVKPAWPCQIWILILSHVHLSIFQLTKEEHIHVFIINNAMLGLFDK